MKKYHILFDLISTQGSQSGGAEFCLTILHRIIQKYTLESHHLIFLYDSNLPIVYEFASPQYLEKEFKFTCVDLARDNSISNIISTYHIDVFFIGIGQILENYSLKNIHCRTIIIFHDLSYIELNDNRLEYFIYPKSFIILLRMFIKNQNYSVLSCFNKKKINPVFQLAANKNIEIFTSSDYSKDSLQYYFPTIKNIISVIYCPEKLIEHQNDITNSKLKEIIASRVKYFIILAANKPHKNAKFAISVFEKFAELNPHLYLLTIGLNKIEFQNHLILPYLTSSDLNHAIKNAYSLIFPSLLEGFGYPPIEAMKYGKPILCSNVCSMPEILSDAPVYFSPYYKVDLYRGLKKVVKDYPLLSEKSLIRWSIIQKKQKESMELISDSILNI
jgi:glycosyltransferase involved in cell wall biosynthesis